MHIANRTARSENFTTLPSDIWWLQQMLVVFKVRLWQAAFLLLGCRHLKHVKLVGMPSYHVIDLNPSGEKARGVGWSKVFDGWHSARAYGPHGTSSMRYKNLADGWGQRFYRTVIRQSRRRHSLYCRWVQSIHHSVSHHINGKTYPRGPEFNLLMDIASAQKVFLRWPTPVIDSGAEVASALLLSARRIETDYSYATNHPVAEAYRMYQLSVSDSQGHLLISQKWPHDHPTPDLTAVLYAARPEGEYFALSNTGRITILPDGSSRFEGRKGGQHQYLILEESQKARALEAMSLLASQPAIH